MKSRLQKVSILLLALVAVLLVVNQAYVQAQVFTGSRSVVGNSSVPPHRAEARLQPNPTATLWSHSAGITHPNNCTIQGGSSTPVQANGGVWIRSMYKGFWSSWEFVPYRLGDTFVLSSVDARAQVILAHAPDTRINVFNGSPNVALNGVTVDVRGGVNSMFQNLVETNHWLASARQTAQGHVLYAVNPYPFTVYGMITRHNWNYIAPITTTGSTVSITVPTNSTTVTVKRMGVPVPAGRTVVAIHEAFWHQNALTSQNFQAHPSPLATDSQGMVHCQPQWNYPIRFVAFDTDGSAHVGQTFTPTSGGMNATRVPIIVGNNPALFAPANNFSSDHSQPVWFSWGTTTNAASYAIYLWDLNSNWDDLFNTGTNRSIGAYFHPGNYGWAIVTYDADGDLMTISQERFFTITGPSPAPSGDGECADQFDTFVDAGMFFVNMDWLVDEFVTGVAEIIEPLEAMEAVMLSDDKQRAELRAAIRQQADRLNNTPVIRLDEILNPQIELPALQNLMEAPTLEWIDDEFNASECDLEEWLDEWFELFDSY